MAKVTAPQENAKLQRSEISTVENH